MLYGDWASARNKGAMWIQPVALTLLISPAEPGSVVRRVRLTVLILGGPGGSFDALALLRPIFVGGKSIRQQHE